MALIPATPEQLADMRLKAAASRARKSKTLAAIESGELTVEQVIADDNLRASLGGTRLVNLLERAPGIGAASARQILDDLDIAGDKKVSGLGTKQIGLIVRAIEG